MRYRFRGIVVACALAAAAGGCGSDAVFPVKGKITFEGKPMKGGGSISFVPTGNQPGKTAGGEIKEDGTYELMTHKPGDGSMPGEFRVVITQVTEQEPQNTGDDGAKAAPKKGLSLPLSDRIPTIYGDPQKSPLRAKVEKGPNELNFDLKRDAGPAVMRNGAARAPLAAVTLFPFPARGE